MTQIQQDNNALFTTQVKSQEQNPKNTNHDHDHEGNMQDNALKLLVQQKSILKDQPSSKKAESEPGLSKDDKGQDEQAEPVEPALGLKELLECFNSYDKFEKGLIGLDQCQTIIINKMGERESLSEQVAYYHHLSLPIEPLKCSFDEFLFIFGMSQKEIHNKEIDFQYNYCKTADSNIIDFMRQSFNVFFRLLTNYRKKCEKQSLYQEAKKSKKKVEEIKEKEYTRRKNYLNVLHGKEMKDVQEQQKQKFVYFCQTWDEFIREYESTASDLVERLRQKQQEELMKFVGKTREELAAKVHFSKQIIELQVLEKNLVKAQEYEKADRVRIEVEEIKSMEMRKKEKEDGAKLELRVDAMKKQQASSLNTLLQKIQKDRNDQTRQRMSDAEKLIVKNKTMCSDLKHRHTESLKKLYEALHNIILDETRMASSTLSSERAKTMYNQNLKVMK